MLRRGGALIGLLMAVVLSGAQAAFLQAAAQQAYPSRPIHILLGFAAGSGADIGARFVSAELQKRAGQPVIIENRPGAGSNIAIGLAAKAKPDGYTLLLAASSAMAGSRFLYKDFKIDTDSAFEPVAVLFDATFVITVAPDSSVQTIAALSETLKTKTRNRFGYTNQTGQLAAAYYLAQAGASAEPVSYRVTADAVADVASGTLDFMVLDGGFATGVVRNGKIKALAVTTAERSVSLPQIPTMTEAGMKDFVFAPFWAVYAPRGTPDDMIKTLQGWLREIYTSDAARQHHGVTGSNVRFQDAVVLRQRLRAEVDEWAKAVQAAGIEPQ
ncbi:MULTISPECIES: tripartite tricarboxylate transporter substrate binding protein [unclassified Beijerinckia]|uniref:Bug family tripartite tricarboxylate transporter substrate binding protein n=1 Tax=unclassified Beijerinckia TaxID=2638183 RepID=UPI00089CF02E|nr:MULTISPECIES: tripartite tricarboxylate transporter substrate binding protein [unclassified Beijerinckia]MDH7795009.1 tripartite-type tricarboxylate transporter receptor subunit TctC [Beijerinckia sp. GAS462]SEB83926.1 Tripartite-type tricarboxylate transporter, receptor component TctC [Beijerinckia sp. 28-YEA-48]